MDQRSLSALKRRVQPIAVNGSLTLEQASAAIALNRDVGRFHDAIAQAERILELAGVLDAHLEHDLAARALTLIRARARVELGLTSIVGDRGRALSPPQSPAATRSRLE